jgi:Secretion system C-terminal sorting domain
LLGYCNIDFSNVFSLHKNKGTPMKLFTVLLVLVFVALFQNNIFSQEIPNAGFENWTDGTPDGWYTDNFAPYWVPVTQSSQSHSGSSAAKLEVVSYFNSNYPPYIWSGLGAYQGFPVSQAYGSLTGYYQFNQIGNDVVYVDVWMQKNGGYVGYGATLINAGTNGYNQFVVPIYYYQNEVPDTASIWIGISDSSGGDIDAGSFVLLDDLAFGGVVGVNDRVPAAETFQLKQNYPNPFNPSTTIEFTVPEASTVEMKVYNILGVEVKSLVSGNYTPGNYKVNFNGENLASGIYIAKIIATAEATHRTFSKTVKMTLLK